LRAQRSHIHKPDLLAEDNAVNQRSPSAVEKLNYRVTVVADVRRPSRIGRTARST